MNSSASLTSIDLHMIFLFHLVSRSAGVSASIIGGKGYATEAAQAPLRTGFQKLNIPEIFSYTPLNNKRSRAVMERLGMRETGETFEHPAVPSDSPLRLHCLYKLSRLQWQ